MGQHAHHLSAQAANPLLAARADLRPPGPAGRHPGPAEAGDRRAGAGGGAPHFGKGAFSIPPRRCRAAGKGRSRRGPGLHRRGISGALPIFRGESPIPKARPARVHVGLRPQGAADRHAHQPAGGLDPGLRGRHSAADVRGADLRGQPGGGRHGAGDGGGHGGGHHGRAGPVRPLRPSWGRCRSTKRSMP